MKIGNIEVQNPLILAPMAGVTDVAFRSICVELGADWGVGELVSSKSLKYGNEKSLSLLYTADNEKVKIAQIFGSSPKIMAEAVKNPALAKFDIIDINMGCPTPKIVKNGEGAALMKDIDLAEKIIRACVEASEKPITVKFRKGWDEEHENYIEFAKMCERAGAAAITIHGRTAKQMYSGNVDLDAIKKVKESVNIPVIGNGDVRDKASYQHMLNYTKVDGVMIGRASMGNPKIFSEIKGSECALSQYDIIEKHITLLRKFYPDRFVAKHMRKHILWYIKGLKNINVFKNEISRETNIEKILKSLKEVYTNQ